MDKSKGSGGDPTTKALGAVVTHGKDKESSGVDTAKAAVAQQRNQRKQKRSLRYHSFAKML